jgi:hypothetical protein
MENPALIGVSLSDVRATTVIIRVLVMEFICQTVMGRIPVLECLLSRVGAYGCVLSCLTLNDIVI